MYTIPTTIIGPRSRTVRRVRLAAARMLLAGTILTPGKRTACSALRAVGSDQEKRFSYYYRVLSPAL